MSTGKLCSLSEQQFVDCDTKNDHGCNGGLMDFAFQFAEEHSLCSEESFPYSAKDGKCPADLESTCSVCIKKGRGDRLPGREVQRRRRHEGGAVPGPGVSTKTFAQNTNYKFIKFF